MRTYLLLFALLLFGSALHAQLVPYLLFKPYPDQADSTRIRAYWSHQLSSSPNKYALVNQRAFEHQLSNSWSSALRAEWPMRQHITALTLELGYQGGTAQLTHTELFQALSVPGFAYNEEISYRHLTFSPGFQVEYPRDRPFCPFLSIQVDVVFPLKASYVFNNLSSVTAGIPLNLEYKGGTRLGGGYTTGLGALIRLNDRFISRMGIFHRVLQYNLDWPSLPYNQAPTSGFKIIQTGFTLGLGMSW